MENHKVKKTVKQKLFHEINEYLINFVYMAIVFSGIVLYRRLLLAHHGIQLNDYFAGVIGAAIIAKVVMLGAFLNISRKFEHHALFIPVLYKSLLFTIMVMIFNIIEALIRAVIHNPVLSDAISEVRSHINLAWLGMAQLIFFIFIPFFAYKELLRIIGKEKMSELFLKRHSAQKEYK